MHDDPRIAFASTASLTRLARELAAALEAMADARPTSSLRFVAEHLATHGARDDARGLARGDRRDNLLAARTGAERHLHNRLEEEPGTKQQTFAGTSARRSGWTGAQLAHIRRERARVEAALTDAINAAAASAPPGPPDLLLFVHSHLIAAADEDERTHSPASRRRKQSIETLWSAPDDEAEGSLRRTLDECRAQYGDQHPETLTAINCLCTLLQAEGKISEAQPLLREAWEASIALWGYADERTLSAASDLGVLLSAQGIELTEAEHLLGDTLRARREKLGGLHHATLDSLYHLSALHWRQGRHLDAKPLLEELGDACGKVLGDGHADTMRARSRLRSLLREMSSGVEEDVAIGGSA